MRKLLRSHKYELFDTPYSRKNYVYCVKICSMIQTLEAIVNETGEIELLTKVYLKKNAGRW
jgi:hypothetical protein